MKFQVCFLQKLILQLCKLIKLIADHDMHVMAGPSGFSMNDQWSSESNAIAAGVYIYNHKPMC